MARFTILLTFAVVALSTLASGRSQKEGAPHNCFQPAPGQPLGVSHVHIRDIGAGVGNQTHDAGETLDARGHRHHRRPHHHGKRPHPHPKHHPAKGQKHGTAQVAHQDNAQQDTVHWGQDSNSWKLVKNIDHTNFFQEMDVFVGDDPSKGMVRYIGMDDARRKGLVNTDNGLIYMALSRRRTNGKYETIRPSTKMTFTEGLVIINVKHMPAACGGWPAIFTVAKDGTWPEKGEIDIAEGVHFYRSNKMSIHTNPGCHMEDWAMSKMLGDLGSESSKNCAAWETQDKGCAVQSSLDDFGISINQNGGGTYMMAWTEDHGIAVYHSAQVPADVASGRPDVSRWGKPTAYFPASSCTPSQFFSQHAVTITNTYGGTWAGNDQVWHWKATMDQSCAERTGHNSFWDYFHTGADLSQAYWSIQNIQIWQKQRKP